MPAATVTIRKLKNKESCVDLSVPTNKEIPGLVTVTVEYHVVVVSDQAVFKSPKHKDTDVVQFMISKHYEDFENLRRKLRFKFSWNVFSAAAQKSFSFGDSAINERRVALDGFLKFVASMSKCVLCRPTLEFLGVDPLKIKSHEVVNEGDRPPHWGLFEDEPKKPAAPKSKRKTTASSPAPDLFGRADSEDIDDLFQAAAETTPECRTETTPEHRTETEEDFLFTGTASSEADTGVKIFDDQDYGEKVEDDKDLFLLPRRQPDTAAASESPLEGDVDLLNIDDDIDQFLSLSIKPNVLSKKPRVPPKSTLASKGQHTSKGPTPGLGKSPKPQLAPKPSLIQKRQVEPLNTDQIGSDDILKYIRDNTMDAGSDLDLFS